MADYKRYPSDRFGERANGIALPFNKQAYGRRYDQHYASGSVSAAGIFVQTYTTEEQAIHNLVNLILTRKGERPMQPLFGTRVPDFLFEQNVESNRFELGESLRADIRLWLPYIILGNLRVEGGSLRTPGDPLHAITIIIPFKVMESGANIVVTFFNDTYGFNYQVERF